MLTVMDYYRLDLERDMDLGIECRSRIQPQKSTGYFIHQILPNARFIVSSSNVYVFTVVDVLGVIPQNTLLLYQSCGFPGMRS